MNLVRNLLVILICLTIHDVSFGCTIISSSSDKSVFAGNNEDMCTTNTEIHIIPFRENGYGRIFWGFIGDENYQGGMNEHGLFFDGAGIPKVKMSPGILPEFKGRYIMETILEKCKTVEEAITLIEKYSHPYLKYAHNLIADATGDAAIIEWGNGRLVILRKGDKSYLIATNFNISESKDIASECQRYNIAEDILSREDPSLESFEKALSLTRQEGQFCTVYSNICDQRNKKVFLYNFHNFAISKELDLVEELKKGEKTYRIRDLFPTNYAELVFRMRHDCIADFEGVTSRDVEFIIQSETLIPTCNISLRGSSTELGRWNEEGVHMEKVSDYSYSKSIKFKEGTLFDFELSVENNRYTPVDNNSNPLKEIVLEVTSDTSFVINVSDWTPTPDTVRAKRFQI